MSNINVSILEPSSVMVAVKYLSLSTTNNTYQKKNGFGALSSKL